MATRKPPSANQFVIGEGDFDEGTGELTQTDVLRQISSMVGGDARMRAPMIGTKRQSARQRGVDPNLARQVARASASRMGGRTVNKTERRPVRGPSNVVIDGAHWLKGMRTKYRRQHVFTPRLSSHEAQNKESWARGVASLWLRRVLGLDGEGPNIYAATAARVPAGRPLPGDEVGKPYPKFVDMTCELLASKDPGLSQHGWDFWCDVAAHGNVHAAEGTYMIVFSAGGPRAGHYMAMQQTATDVLFCDPQVGEYTFAHPVQPDGAPPELLLEFLRDLSGVLYDAEVRMRAFTVLRINRRVNPYKEGSGGRHSKMPRTARTL